MKRNAGFLLCAFLLIIIYSESEGKVEIVMENNVVKCNGGKFSNDREEVTVPLDKSHSEIFICKNEQENEQENEQIYVKIRLCENCIQVSFSSLSAIIAGNVVATILIGWAVYSISAQPRTRNFSGFKASDKQNLISPSDGLYQGLNRNDTSEYSGIAKR